MSITVPTEMAEFVAQKVQSGEYASDSEVIRDGLRMLRARDTAVEQWLRTEVAAAFDDMKSRGTAGKSAEQMRAALAEHRRLRSSG